MAMFTCAVPHDNTMATLGMYHNIIVLSLSTYERHLSLFLPSTLWKSSITICLNSNVVPAWVYRMLRK